MSGHSAIRAAGASKRGWLALALAGVLIWGGAGSAAAAETTPQLVYSFTGAGGGARANAVVQAPDGYLYGTTTYSSGGEEGWGVFYRVKPDGSGYQALRNFSPATDGGLSMASPIVGQDGAIYGSNSEGTGNATWGTLWRYSSAGQFSVIVTFNMANGGYPASALVQDGAGTLYGAAGGGGAGGRGVVFSVQPDGSQMTVLHHFSGDAAGGIPRGIALGNDGRIYGAAAIGGDTGEGTVFSLARDGSDYKVLHAFNSSAGDGSNPQSAPVLLPSDGSLYGITNNGGSGGYGTVYKVTPGGQFTTVLSFDDASNGAFPTAALIVGANGSLYGSTPYGGPSRQYGTLFQMSPRGKVLGVVSLTESAYQPQVALARTPDGQMVTTTAAGGSSGNGAIVKVDPAAFPSPVKTLPTEQIYFNQIYPPLTTSQTKVGKRMQLHWVSEYANYCTASGPWSGRLAPEGIRYIKHDTPGEYVYTLTCTNANGSTTTNQTLYVTP